MNKEELMARPMRKKFLFVIAMLSLSILMTGCKMGGGGDNTTTYVPAPPSAPTTPTTPTTSTPATYQAASASAALAVGGLFPEETLANAITNYSCLSGCYSTGTSGLGGQQSPTSP